VTAQMPRSPRHKGQREIGGVGGRTPWRGRQNAVPEARAKRRWGVILAGGDGIRLRPLTRFICGDDRPKQFCPLLRESSLVQEARQRAERSIHPDQILYSVTRAHQDYYVRDLADRSSQRVVQPGNRGTAPAILSALLCISQMDPDAIVAILPCDHYYSQESMFTSALESAFAIAEERTESIVLLGAQPKTPEVEYGWIELGESVAGPHTGAFHVRGFQEKPSLPVAKRLLRSGSLWNTFVMVGHVSAFLDAALASVPDLLQALRSARLNLDRDCETRIAEWLYDQIAPTDFSRQVLSPGTRRLVTLPLGEIEWNDLGDPDRVLSTLLESELELPSWAARWRRETEVEPSRIDTSQMAVA
jgi:mannose-1-phosphate guanylyltransferase